MNDPHKASYYHPTSYSISVGNPSLLALGDVITTDKIPDQLKLDGPVTASTTSATIRYHTGTGTVVPTYDTATIASGSLGT